MTTDANGHADIIVISSVLGSGSFFLGNNSFNNRTQVVSTKTTVAMPLVYT